MSISMSKQQFLEYARNNEDSADPIFQEIERDDAGKEPKTIEDPDRSQLSVNGPRAARDYFS